VCYSFVLFSQFDSFSFFLERLGVSVGVGVVADAFSAALRAKANSVSFLHYVEKAR